MSQTCSSPAASLILRNAALPNGRTARTRPAIDQAPGSLSISSAGAVAVPLAQILREVVGPVAVAVRVHAERAQRLGLLHAMRDDLALGGAEVVAAGVVGVACLGFDGGKPRRG